MQETVPQGPTPALDLDRIIELDGAPGGSRTPNPQIRSLMLYPLSYGRVRPSFSPIFNDLSTRDATEGRVPNKT